MFENKSYTLRKKILKLFGGSYEIFDENQNLVLFAEQKAFKLKEDIRLFSSKEKTEEILSIKARNIMDFSATYDVIDTRSGEKVGVLKRNGLKSLAQDEWFVLDASEKQIGIVREDSLFMALLRRFLTSLIPQNYDFLMNDKRVCDLQQNFNPFVYKLNIDFSENTEGLLDVRLGLAMAVLLAAIEGKQE
jgi:hypothetical protein